MKRRYRLTMLPLATALSAVLFAAPLANAAQTPLVSSTVASTTKAAPVQSATSTPSTATTASNSSTNSSTKSTRISPQHPHGVRPGKQLWNLQNADIHAVIQTISEITGKSFIVDPRVQGKVTIISTKPMSNKEIYQVFLSMLQVLNYSAIPSGNVVKIVPSMSAKEYGGTVATGSRPGHGDQVVVRIVPVNNVSASQLVPILRPLMQEWGSVSAYTPSNTLIFAGTAANISRLVGIVEQMDQRNASTIQVLKLKYANAEKVSAILAQLASKDKSEGKVDNVSVVADPENNSLLISGTPVNRASIIKIINSLDTPASNGSANTVVMHLNYLTAKEIAPILTKIAHGQIATQNKKKGGAADATTQVSDSEVSIQPEKSNNAIIISAPQAMIQNLEQVVKKLDVAPQQVLVEAVIVQVNESVINKLGIVWGTQLNLSGSDSAAAAAASADPLAAAGMMQGMGFIPGGNIRGLITALQQTSSADILSTPTILVLNNQQATISNGETVSMINRQYATTDPNSTTGDETPFNTLSRQNVALTLKVTPQISPNKMVQLKIDQEDNSLANPTNPGSSPLENTNSIKTSVLVKSGDILVLGGLLKHDNTGGFSKVPILGDIPVLGGLFRYKNKSAEKNNLMIFIKPVILSSAEARKAETDKRYRYMRYQEMKARGGVDLLNQQSSPMLPSMTRRRALRLPSPFAK